MAAGQIYDGERGPAPVFDGARAEMIRLDAVADSAGDARRFVRDQLADTDPGTLDTVLLVATELVTNAVLHAARPPIDLTLVVTGDAILVSVFDCERAEPKPRALNVESSDGRGIALVAMVSRNWGTNVHDGGKTVWAVINRGRNTA